MRERIYLLPLFIFLVLNQISCSQKKGTFAFSLVESQTDENPIYNSIQPNSFKSYRNPIVFPQGQDIWFLYIPAVEYPNKIYGVSLSQKTLGYNEIDLRNQILNPNRKMLIEEYKSIPPGNYILRIAYKNKVIDSIDFEVRESPDNQRIDYDAPLIEETEEFSEQSIDDILLYSKSKH